MELRGATNPSSASTTRSRRTSIDLPARVYEYIASQVESGREKSLRDMFLKLVDLHRYFDIGSWNLSRGILRDKLHRWCVMSDAEAHLLETLIPREKLFDAGQDVGMVWREVWANKPALYNSHLEATDSLEPIGRAWRLNGWGSLDVEPRSGTVLVADPIFSSEFIRGLLTAVLGRELRRAPMAYEQNSSLRVYAYEMVSGGGRVRQPPAQVGRGHASEHISML